LVGLTGSVAAGKSAVGRLFEGWGATRIDADELAREAVAPGTEGLRRIRDLWGDEVLHADGSLDRSVMRRRVFADPEARARLEGIVHEEIRRLREVRRSRAASEGASIIVEEVPLLFEKGQDREYDVLVVVDAPRETRVRRARASRGWSAEEFSAVDASQLAAEQKRRRADYVIENDDDLETLERMAHEVWSVLVQSVRSRRDVPEPVDAPRPPV